MGKGTRSRNARADEIIADPVKFSKKKDVDKAKLATRIGVAVCAVLLVACIALWGFTSWIPRIITVAKSDNFKVNGGEMTYFVNTLKNNYINTVSQYGSTYLTQLGIDASDTSLTGLKSQKCALDSGKSWYEYFLDQAKNQVEQMFVLCEAAKAEGMKLDDSEKESIKESIKAMKESAEELAKAYAENGYTGYSVSYFLTQQYGNGVSEGNVRKAMELSALSSKYLKAYEERVKAGVTDEEIQKYFDANPAVFLTADVYSYSFPAVLELKGSEATEEEKAAYETAKEKAKKLADELAACADKDAFIAKAVEYITGTYASEQFDSLYEAEKSKIAEDKRPTDEKLASDRNKILTSLVKKVKGEVDKLDKPATSTQKDTYEYIINKVCDELLEDVQGAYDAINETSSVGYSDPADKEATDLTKWLFDSARKAGDKTMIKSEAEKKSTYTAYYLDATAHRDDTVTKNVGHILFSTEKYEKAEEAKKKAEEILAQYKAGNQTKEAFEELAKQYTADGSVFYDNVNKGQMVESFEEWLFDDARTVGEVGIVETTYGAHIMYFVGDGEVAWRVTAVDGVYGEKYDAWYENAKKEAGVNFKNSALKNLG